MQITATRAADMDPSGHFWTFWYFNIPNYLLAALIYTLLGRLLLGLMMPPSAGNYIWRAFVRLTDPVLGAVAAITPALLDGLLIPIAVFWLFVLRVALLTLLTALGLAPTI